MNSTSIAFLSAAVSGQISQWFFYTLYSPSNAYFALAGIFGVTLICCALAYFFPKDTTPPVILIQSLQTSVPNLIGSYAFLTVFLIDTLSVSGFSMFSQVAIAIKDDFIYREFYIRAMICAMWWTGIAVSIVISPILTKYRPFRAAILLLLSIATLGTVLFLFADSKSFLASSAALVGCSYPIQIMSIELGMEGVPRGKVGIVTGLLQFGGAAGGLIGCYLIRFAHLIDAKVFLIVWMVVAIGIGTVVKEKKSSVEAGRDPMLPDHSSPLQVRYPVSELI